MQVLTQRRVLPEVPALDDRRLRPAPEHQHLREGPRAIQCLGVLPRLRYKQWQAKAKPSGLEQL